MLYESLAIVTSFRITFPLNFFRTGIRGPVVSNIPGQDMNRAQRVARQGLWDQQGISGWLPPATKKSRGWSGSQVIFAVNCGRGGSDDRGGPTHIEGNTEPGL